MLSLRIGSKIKATAHNNPVDIALKLLKYMLRESWQQFITALSKLDRFIATIYFGIRCVDLA
jgi:hypothetical protein